MKKILIYLHTHRIKISQKHKPVGVAFYFVASMLVAFMLPLFSVKITHIPHNTIFFFQYIGMVLFFIIAIIYMALYKGLAKHKKSQQKIYSIVCKSLYDYLFPKSWMDFYFILIRGVLASGTYYAFFVSSSISEVIDNSTLSGLDPILVTVAVHFFLKHKISPTGWFGVFLGAVGVVVFFQGGDTLSTGIIWGLCSAVGFATITFITSFIVSRNSVLTVGLYQAIAGLILILPFLSPDNLVIPDFRPLSAILVTGGLLFPWALIFFLYAFKYTETHVLAVVGYSTPIFSLLFSFVVVGESAVSLKELLGILVIAASGIAVITDSYRGGNESHYSDE